MNQILEFQKNNIVKWLLYQKEYYINFMILKSNFYCIMNKDQKALFHKILLMNNSIKSLQINYKNSQKKINKELLLHLLMLFYVIYFVKPKIQKSFNLMKQLSI